MRGRVAVGHLYEWSVIEANRSGKFGLPGLEGSRLAWKTSLTVKRVSRDDRDVP